MGPPQSVLLSFEAAPLSPPPTLSQAVVEQLRDSIIAGDIPPGALLRETALARMLGVSPTPVREALAVLAGEGLVEIETHRLKRAAPIERKSTKDLFRVQVELWRLGYMWGVPNVGPRELDRMAQALADYGAAVDQGESLRAIRAGHDFHSIIIAASDNGELLRSTLDRLSLIARFVLLYGRHTVNRRALSEHEGILRAIRRGEQDEVLDRYERLSLRLIELADSALPSAEKQERD